MKARDLALFGVFTFFFFVFVLLAGCTSKGGTETGTTGTVPFDTLTVGTKIQSIASAMVPDINAGEAESAANVLGEIAYGTADDWAVYLQSMNVTVLSDIFGDPDVEPRVITKIRVLVEEFVTQLQSVVDVDPDFECAGGSVLDAGDTIDIAFYGSISNGTSGDRYFSCVGDFSGTDENGAQYVNTKLYGIDSSGLLHFVYMWQYDGPNSNPSASSASTARELRVVYATYAEESKEIGTEGYLDLQSSAIVIYGGDDDQLLTPDDVIFKARSRITGQASLDDDDNVQIASSDFTVTKYDKGFGGTMEGEWNIITMSLGRGSYGDGDHSIFRIDNNQSTLSDVAGTYCIKYHASTLPSYADSANCESYETSYAWSGSTFPFTITPALEQDFESKPFFQGNDTDMIANDGSNFTIPDYSSFVVQETAEGE